MLASNAVDPAAETGCDGKEKGKTPNGIRALASSPAVAAGETFDGTWPFQARYSEAPGFRMHFVEEGAGPETLLLLHGEPTWGEADRTLQAAQFLPLFSQAFPDGQIRRLPGVGHHSPEDAPDEVARIVADFLAGQ